MILVTGGTGFIGRVLINNLAANGHSVRILLRPFVGSPRLPKKVPLDIAVSSLSDKMGLAAALQGINCVYHLAGTERQGSRADLMGVDVNGTANLVELASEAGVKRFIFLSHLGADRQSAFPVLKAKALAEHAITSSDLDYTIIRSAAVFGDGDQFTTAFARLINILPGYFLLPGDGSVLLQPLWVEDLAVFLAWCLEDPKTIHQTYSIGGIEYLSLRQILDLILEKIGRKRSMISLSPPIVRMLAVSAEHNSPNFPVSIFWLDYLATNRTCELDTLPRVFNIMPSRLSHQIGYLKDYIGKK